MKKSSKSMQRKHFGTQQNLKDKLGLVGTSSKSNFSLTQGSKNTKSATNGCFRHKKQKISCSNGWANSQGD